MAVVKRIAQGTTAAALFDSAQSITYGVEVKLGAEATGRIAIGFSDDVTAETDVLTDGYQLSAGESIWLPKSVAGDLTSVFLIATAPTQNVYILAL